MTANSEDSLGQNWISQSTIHASPKPEETRIMEELKIHYHIDG
ncbi:hypothetical protein [Gilvimarinus algae]|uniref:Uncharacterized protein n=1 Tax=Gilvimarinus algae TaxID=3058037 RepID=A0ABT8TL82_9GAMM|nr:hypothetical protein [Gilvimarinus sp. SDUM040014]MDO3383863.1 hypothetical protein [Gilvimarinus sp. SDUM040014]